MQMITRTDQITLSEIGERLAMVEKRYRERRRRLDATVAEIQTLDAERPDEDRRINQLGHEAIGIENELRSLRRLHPWLLSEVR